MRIHNFAAGPAALPLPVLERAREELVDYRGTGMSVLEMSHRSPAYDEIHHGAMAAVRRLMGVPEGWSILFLQGGASLQFSMVPMNLMHPRRRADYVLTGSWAKKAAAEARREGEVRIAASTEGDGFRRVPGPGELDLDADADYLHLTTNNTIFGTQMRELPVPAADVPLVVDMSSDVLSWPVPVERLGLLYAGAQKNLGPAGVTLVIVRDDLLERAPQSLATMLQYRTHAAADSLYNTPPTFAIYLMGLCLAWVEEQGGVAAMEAASRRKADTLYAAIDGSDFYRGTAEPASRSRMNVTFRLAEEALEKAFLAEAAEARPSSPATPPATPMVQLKGHRSVGGVRASLYNAVPQQAVDDLVAFMADFERRHG